VYQNPDGVRTAAVRGLVRTAWFDLFSADSAQLERNRWLGDPTGSAEQSGQLEMHPPGAPPSQPLLVDCLRRGYLSENTGLFLQLVSL